MERRQQITTLSHSEGRRLTGYASVFNSPTEIADVHGRTFREIIRPGAFSRALKESQDVAALFNHDPNRLLGRLSSGTLRLLEDHKGLWFEVLVPEHEQGLLKLAERKDLNGASFGFMVTRDKWGEGPTREIFDVDLVDVSIVTFPAYSSTSVDVRQKNCVNLATYKARLRLLEEETFGGKCLS